MTWKVAVGDTVTLNQPLVDIETAKATVELPSPFEGTVTSLLAAAGRRGRRRRVIITIEVEGAAEDRARRRRRATSPRRAPRCSSATASRPTTPRRHGATAGRGAQAPRHRAPAARRGAGSTCRGAAARRPRPQVREVAGIDVASLHGTGRAGHVTRDDVDRAAAGGPASARRDPAAPCRPDAVRRRRARLVGRGPRRGADPRARRAPSMAEAMTKSAFSAPHAAAWVRVDATRTVELVASLRDRPRSPSVRLTPLSIIALAACDAARRTRGSTRRSTRRPRRSSCVAASRSGSLQPPTGASSCPTSRRRTGLDLVAMARALDALVASARAGTTTPADMLGTTLTITNVGPFGIDGAVPILRRAPPRSWRWARSPRSRG